MATNSEQTGARKLIGQLMLDAGLITKEQLDEALSMQQRDGMKVAEALIVLGHIDAEKFVGFLARQPGVASIDLTGYETPKELIELIPREMATKYEVFPIDRMANLLTLGMVCPLDSHAIAALESRTGLRVKPLLCAPDDIRNAIRRYYPDEQAEPMDYRPAGFEAPSGEGVEAIASSMRLHSIVPMIRRISSLPALPHTVEQVREATVDPDIALSDVAAIIETDPAVAAKVLSVANSAAYGFPHRVDRIDRAVSLLGLRETYAIVLGVAVINLFEKSSTFDYEHFWKNSLACATAIRVVSKRVYPQKNAAQMVPIGLLLGIGRIALNEVAPERYGKVPGDLLGADLIAEEQRVCAIAYPEAGYELASHWALPDEMAKCIRFHHAPDQADEPREQVALANLAWLISNQTLDDDARSEQAAAALEILGLSPAALTELAAEFAKTHESAE